jgi:hypothetical protein
VPARLAAHGIQRWRSVHFHVPSRESAYLAELRAALDAAGVELWSVLIDDGDIAHPEHGARDRDWVLGWIDTAGELGARCVRVIGGKQEPSPDALARSREHLLGLVVEAYLRGVRVMTENWFPLLSSPPPVHALLGGLNDTVGLCLDFGNWGGDTKYDHLAGIAPLAESCHAKCTYRDGRPDTDDYTRCLEITRAADYSGPYTLVYAEPGDVWGTIAEQRDLLRAYVEAPAASGGA